METKRALGAILVVFGVAVAFAGILLARSGSNGCGADLCVGPSGNLMIAVSALVGLVFVLAGLDLVRSRARSRNRSR